MKRIIICAAFVFASLMTGAKADSCDSILTAGLRNITVSYSAEAAIAHSYYNNYQKDFHAMSDDQLATAEAEIFGSGKGNAGYSRAQRENDLRVWVETNKATAESAKKEYEYSNLIYQGSIQAWSDCNALRAKSSVEINPVISPDSKTVAMSVRYIGFTKSGVKFYGVNAEGFQCNINVPSEKLVEGIEIIGESISVYCTRAPSETIIKNGEEFRVLPRGTIAVRTAANPFLLSFAEETTPALPKAAEDRLAALVQQLSNRVASLEANLKSAAAQLDAKIGTVDLSWRQMVNPLRTDFDQKAVKYDDQIKLFTMMGADQGRCIAVPGNLSGLANFPCSADDVGKDQARATWRVKK